MIIWNVSLMHTDEDGSQWAYHNEYFLFRRTAEKYCKMIEEAMPDTNILMGGECLVFWFSKRKWLKDKERSDALEMEDLR